MKLTSLLIILISLSTACSGQSEKQVEKTTEVKIEIVKLQTSESFKSTANSVIAAYLELKDALVGTDAEAAQSKASDLTKTVENVDQTGLTDETKAAWLELKAEIENLSRSIANESDVAQQRTDFFALSNTMEKMVKNLDAGELTLYKQYCPMAFNNTGATWLSSEKQIRNPYFGDKMLKCGSVKEVL